MRLIELTDGMREENIKEYVDADSVTNIMPDIRRSRRFGLFGSIKTEIKGSLVFTLGCKYPTYVKETPEQVKKLIENKYVPGEQ